MPAANSLCRGRNTDVMDRTRQGQGDCNSKNRNGGLGAPEALAAMRLLVVPQEDSSEAAETDGLTPNIVSSRRSADQLRDMRRRIRSVKDRLHQLSSGNSTSVSVLSGGSSDRPDDDYSAASEQRGDVWQSLAFTTYPRLVPDHHSYKLPPTTDGPTVTRGSAPMGASSGSSQRLQRSAYGVSRDRYESTAAVLKKQLREHHRDELIAELTAKYASSPAAENGNSRPIVAPPRKPAEVYSGDERSVSHVLEESAIEALVRYRREFLDYVTKIRDAELERSDATSWYLCDVLTDQLLRECIDSVTDSVCDDVDTYVDRLIEFEIS
ncbi:hypothetical protein FOZ61_003310 [Perkinsus olseni]|uniref:Uncharacterized protein n=1 Tax=Perkinsus olseni TaxID=32597 RepID=A0A7J6ME72_PEROL|nr:hypothetical protein FOZ61_003310 [Perkinsus olseni]KAF4674947.1 hypothetical protein FOL46_003394 [Perkinsus olseni]